MKPVSKIDEAFALKSVPVYVVTRHGRTKKLFSRSAAISNLAHFMAQKTFDRAGISTHEGGYQREENGVIIFSRGELTVAYLQAHYRCERRIRKIIARKREKEKWQREYDEWTAKHDELIKRRPY
ncbi:hypothetical protein [Serratia sp. 1D1416]|uniref:hypothetical protein n=1 Tax=Serratia sp. 1D1416 TaxID=2447890 RepID=UPI001013C4FE|nr:hypothetical protein [Serratia sp. 1D1416]